MARDRSARPDRRQFVKLAGASGAVLAVAACGRRDDGEPAPASREARAPSAAVDRPVVRVASVPTAVEGNVLPALITTFEQRTRYRVELLTTPLLYELARAGKVDLAISHYGHRDAEAFVMDGLGEWPRTIFSNQMALVGPPADPAGVRGLPDAGEAFRRIAAARSPFLLNDLDGVTTSPRSCGTPPAAPIAPAGSSPPARRRTRRSCARPSSVPTRCGA
jgi:DNA-binding transcriptional LysR family regulator